ncbi:hypothetical protein [Pseudomonas sp. 2FE]|uniref:hypothetical protein n=1 Tax=Pseudomonas sp. 2FE TaxID=2502190 RepID=UPI0010F77C45|nr:hypothetical protein [Pseudomonas sp. 2FE]
MDNKPVINLTKFKTTGELEGFGVRDLSSWKEFQEIRNLLFFPVLPNKESVAKRVERLSEIALAEAKKTGATTVLVSCPPWMMHSLCAELIYHNLTPVVSFTKKTNEDSMSVIDLVTAA